MSSSYNSSSTKPIYRATQIVLYILGIIEILLIFRLGLKLLGADPVSGFSSFIYGVTYIFSTPFLSVFYATPIVDGTVFEWTTLLAMVVYWVVALGIIKLLLIGKSVSIPEAAIRLDNQEE